ncbi:MAG: type IV pilus modification protein PilV [Gallionella sp.]|nr:type IV pilus modification protein PilV [Gallionella sp.]
MVAMGHQHIVTSFTTGATRACRASRPTRRASGFSLVEVLVSIVVLSFGLLGMVGMQAASLKANREARLQSSAMVLARELAEMVRSNNAIGILTGAANPYLGSFSSPLAAATPTYCLSVGTTACADNTAIANAEMTEWLARVDTELPGARVDVCFDAAPFDTTTGLPRWACAAGTSGVIVVKIGWTRGSTDRSKSGAAAFERATIPSIVFPVTAGSVL